MPHLLVVFQRDSLVAQGLARPAGSGDHPV